MNGLRDHLVNIHKWSDDELFEVTEEKALDRIHRADHRQGDYYSGGHSVDNLRIRVAPFQVRAS